MKNTLIILAVLFALVVVAVIIGNRQGTMHLDETILAELTPEDQSYFQELNENIRSGGPPKDGIPSVDKPQYESAAAADEWLQDNDVVFGLNHNGTVLAYPQRILVWHEIANDTIGGDHVTVSYCPLTGTAIGYTSPSPGANNPSLGVSGKLVNSNLIMYDRATDSYWPQILGQSIVGPETGKQLGEFPITWTTWAQWKQKYPETKVLSRETGFFRNYNVGGDPYGSYLSGDGYYSDSSIIFSPLNMDNRFPPKTVVVGIRDKDRNAVAILKDTLREQKIITVSLGGEDIEVVYDESLDFYTATYKDSGEWINAFDAMWFAWFGYYPHTEVIQ